MNHFESMYWSLEENVCLFRSVLCLTGWPGWPEQDALRVGHVLMSRGGGGGVTSARCTGPRKPTLVPGAVLPNVEPAAQKLTVLIPCQYY